MYQVRLRDWKAGKRECVGEIVICRGSKTSVFVFYVNLKSIFHIGNETTTLKNVKPNMLQ